MNKLQLMDYCWQRDILYQDIIRNISTSVFICTDSPPTKEEYLSYCQEQEQRMEEVFFCEPTYRKKY